MKVTLINPPQIFSRYQIGAYLVPPLGIGYLASYLLSKDIEVQVIDALKDHQTVTGYREDIFLRGMTFTDILRQIDPDANLIGISNLFSYASTVVEEISQLIKKTLPDIPIVLGGPHPSSLPEQSLRRANADYVIFGEGEFPLYQLCLHLQNRLKREEVIGLGYLSADNTRLIRNLTNGRIYNLNAESIPWPARHLLPLESYIKEMEGHGSSNKRWTTILSSRGCPYGCTFCQSRKTKWVSRSAKDVVDEIEFCVNEYNIHEFHFEDDNMTISKKRTVEICDEIIARNLDIVWQTPNGIRASVVDEATLRKMKESGCSHITLAPESGSPRVLNEIIAKGRDFKLDHLRNVGQLAHAMGMKVAAYFIIGLPGEKPEDVELTIEFAKKLARDGVDEAGFAHFIPLPGTPLWNKCVNEGEQIDFLDLLVASDLNRSKSWAPGLSAEQIKHYRKKAYRSFIITRAIYHPWATMKTVFNVLGGIAETKTENYIRMFLKQAGLKRPNDAENPHVTMKHEAIYAYSDTLLRTLYLILFDIVPSLLFKNRKS